MEGTTEEQNTQPAETAAFSEAYNAVEEARKQTDVLAADIGRHLNSLRDGDNVCRTSETQAALSLADTETIMDTLLEGRDALLTLLVVLAKSGEPAAQSNDAKAKRVSEILDKMEADGEFDGLSEDDAAGERQLRGMQLRADME